jgi:hypothetical protein
MIGPGNRIWIVLLLAGLILSFGHADAQQGQQIGAPNPYRDLRRRQHRLHIYPPGRCGKHWLLCALSALPLMTDNEQDCIRNAQGYGC